VEKVKRFYRKNAKISDLGGFFGINGGDSTQKSKICTREKTGEFGLFVVVFI